MTRFELTPLEVALLEVFHGMYGTHGFPRPESIGVRHRENTGAGRYTDLHVDQDTSLEDGRVDLGGRFVEMEGVPNGLMAVVRIKAHRPDQLEIVVYGDSPWDGRERKWSIA